MKAQMARLVISVVSMAVAIVIFMAASSGWVSVLVPALVVSIGFAVGHAVFQRLADLETRRGDLEERVRNQHL
jgi:hypothetical protein